MRRNIFSDRHSIMTKKYLVTPALPYANGDAHLGHLVEHIQVNIFVRALRMAGESVLNVCGADSHGTPIELNARKAGVRPEEFAATCQRSHEASFKRFFVEFDGGYGTTHTSENEAHAGRIFSALEKAGKISIRSVERLFDPDEGRFLPDRMVKGTCPKCDTPDQYGDSCESCGATYAPTDLLEPQSVISGATPILKESDHYFVDLASFTDVLKAWTSQEGIVPDEVRNYLNRWFEDGLKDWDISRDGPYFGFPIPGSENKYFYVWLDAPIGYISLTERALKESSLTWEDYWKDPDTQIVHFIGKDIIYFHTLFWPAMLHAAGYTLPAAVPVHGMLTVNGVKMSKSRGTFILADDFAEKLGETGAQALRYYYACKLGAGIDDIDLNLEDFTLRVNADLVNKVVNLISRTVPMIHRFCDGKPSTMDPQATEMIERVRSIGRNIEGHYRALNYAQVVRDVVAMADEGNRYLQDQKPWEIAKTNPEQAAVVLTTALWVGKSCLAFLGPIIPKASEQTSEMLNLNQGFTFENAMNEIASGESIQEYPRLFERLQMKDVMSLVKNDDTPDKTKTKKSNQPKGQQPAKTKQKDKSAKSDQPGVITIDEFMNVDLRAARVVEANDVDGAEKLIAVKLDVGDLGMRQVFAGLKPHVQPADLLNKMVIVVANLKPRKMRFGLSEGMILAAGEDVPTPIFSTGAQPGDRVR